jgi:ABC-type uncharacterized transport system substrate-binding protein
MQAQQPGQTRRIGLLVALTEDDPEAQSRVRAFRFGLRDLDWLEGSNIHIDYRFAAGDPVRIKEQVAELVSLTPDVIVGNGTPVLAALRKATLAFQSYFRSSMIQWAKASSQACPIREAISQGSPLSTSQ